MTIELKPTNLIAVPIPTGATNFDFINTHTKVLTHSLGQVELGLPTLDRYRVLGTISATEIGFDAEAFVDYYALGEKRLSRNYTKDRGTKGAFGLNTAPDSFRSLLQANGAYFENPFGERLFPNIALTAASIEARDRENERWQSAQLRTSPVYAILEKVNN